MKFSVDPWDPAYGIANETVHLEESSAEDVVVDVEYPVEDWRPLATDAVMPAATSLFVDGVRRVEARIWVDDRKGGVVPGICASYAAGVARCNSLAEVGPFVVGRGVFTAFGGATDVETTAGTFPVRLAGDDSVEGLALALQSRMGQAEVQAAEAGVDAGPADLIVIDGPLRGRQHLLHAVGYVKTHHVAYLPSDLHAVVGRLAPGERTPLFTLGTSWSRLSWYQRLPGGGDAPWSGVARGMFGRPADRGSCRASRLRHPYPRPLCLRTAQRSEVAAEPLPDRGS